MEQFSTQQKYKINNGFKYILLFHLFYNSSSYIGSNKTKQEVNDKSGGMWTEAVMAYFSVLFTWPKSVGDKC
jgi:hypothetical protein